MTLIKGRLEVLEAAANGESAPYAGSHDTATHLVRQPIGRLVADSEHARRIEATYLRRLRNRTYGLLCYASPERAHAVSKELWLPGGMMRPGRTMSSWIVSGIRTLPS